MQGIWRHQVITKSGKHTGVEKYGDTTYKQLYQIQVTLYATISKSLSLMRRYNHWPRNNQMSAVFLFLMIFSCPHMPPVVPPHLATLSSLSILETWATSILAYSTYLRLSEPGVMSAEGTNPGLYAADCSLGLGDTPKGRGHILPGWLDCVNSSSIKFCPGSLAKAVGCLKSQSQ